MALTDIAVDTTGDLIFEAGRFQVVQGRRAVAQRIMMRFQVFKGEWFLNLSQGVPYRQEIIVKNPRLSVLDVLIRQVITETPSVVGLQRFVATLNRDERGLLVDFLAETSEGEIPGTAVFGGTIAPEFLMLLGD